MNDVQDIPRAFSPYFVIDNEAEDFLRADCGDADGAFYAEVSSSFAPPARRTLTPPAEPLLYKKKTKHFLKNLLYDYLSDFLNITLPYGSLTGVRPTKLFYELWDNGADALDTLKTEFRVSHEKALLIAEVAENQRGIYTRDSQACDIFINIPFCPSRCNYCSFISNEVSRVKKRLPDYVNAVKTETLAIINHIAERGLTLRAIYVGGGTPTSIGADNLAEILRPLACRAPEFTVEAGRPDTVDAEMLDAMKSCGVTRLSVNPQSFHQRTLDAIGRKHSTERIYEAFFLSRAAGFEINMDLIAMLEGESEEDFFYSVDRAAELAPENITIHTLSLKRGAVISDREKQPFGTAERMVNYAHKRLHKDGYKPYYMYRQKNIADNLENTGYCLPGKACVYNVDMMEESVAVFAAGAGGMSKLLLSGNRLERRCNPKGLNEYLERLPDILKDKFKE